MTAKTSSCDVLVTGATGFIGTHLVRRLLADGAKVRCLVREPSKFPEDFKRTCEMIQGDLANTNALLKAVDGVTVVFHCAGNVKSWDERAAYFEANVDGVENLLQAISSANPGLHRLVHLSTVDVYGFPALPCSELADTFGGGFGYGESKLRGEGVVRRLCMKKNISFTIIRPTNVIGPGSQFIERIGTALQSGLMLKINGGCANAGLVHVDTLVDHLVWAARADVADGESYNVRDAYDVTWAEFISALRSSLRGKGYIVDLPLSLAMPAAALVEAFYKLVSLPGEPFLHRLLVSIFGRTCGHDASKIRAHSGLSSRVGFDEALAQSVRWFVERETSH